MKRKLSFIRSFSNEWIKFDIHQTFSLFSRSWVKEKWLSSSQEWSEESEKGKKYSFWCLLNSKTDAFALNIKNDLSFYASHTSNAFNKLWNRRFRPNGRRETNVSCLLKLTPNIHQKNFRRRYIFVFLPLPLSPAGRRRTEINCVSHDFLIMFTTHPRTHVVCNYVYLFKLLSRKFSEKDFFPACGNEKNNKFQIQQGVSSNMFVGCQGDCGVKASRKDLLPTRERTLVTLSTIRPQSTNSAFSPQATLGTHVERSNKRLTLPNDDNYITI